MEPQDMLIVSVGLVVMFAFVGCMVWLLSGWKGASYTGNEEIRIWYCMPLRIVGYIFFGVGICFPVFIGALIYFKPPGEMGAVVGVIVMAVVCFLTAIYVFREVREVYATISPEGIAQYSPWWGHRQILWGNLDRVEIVERGFITFFSVAGVKLEFKPQYWAGFGALKTAIYKHVNRSKIKVVPGMF